ncbi:hypothetical protein [Nonomuraea sp. NPDC003804]|uniref:hypothetical protein n=1 Tax=Nonomuraea sp. NPDC003804 TaxID=3154547 RepID=UPI0033B71CC3
MTRNWAARLRQHGEVAGLPRSVEVLSDSPEEVAVRLAVRTRRLPYRVEKVFRIASGTAALEIQGRVTNEAGVALHAMWGHHLVYGRPFLRPGARVRVPEGVTVMPVPRRTGRGGAGRTWWGWSRSPACRRTAWPRLWTTGPRCSSGPASPGPHGCVRR